MSITTFEDAKIGDKVFSHTFGWGVIECIDTRSFFPIEVRFYESGVYETFTLKGYCYDDLPIQSLFWNEVNIEAPIKPVSIKVINGIEIPNISFRPDNQENYHYPYPSHPQLYSYTSFKVGDHVDEFRVAHDMCYPISPEGKAAAILHAKAMLKSS